MNISYVGETEAAAGSSELMNLCLFLLSEKPKKQSIDVNSAGLNCSDNPPL